MKKEKRIILYFILTVLIEGSSIYGIFALSNNLNLNDRRDTRYVARQYLYFIAYNIGYVLVFPMGMAYSYPFSGILAMMIGCVGMFVIVYLVGEFITLETRKRASPIF